MHGAFCRTPRLKVIVQTASAIRSGVHHDELSRANRPDRPPSPTVSSATAGSASDGGSRSCLGWLPGSVTVGIISYPISQRPGQVTHPSFGTTPPPRRRTPYDLQEVPQKSRTPPVRT